jgi:hypothetical protein
LQSKFEYYDITPEFLQFSWSGSNSIAARSVAARSLATHITAASKNEPSCPHLVIAHSHGGNVALLASKVQENYRLHVVTLATPFTEVYASSFLDVSFLRFIFVLFSTWVIGWVVYYLIGTQAPAVVVVSFALAYGASYVIYNGLIRATPFDGMSQDDFQASWLPRLLVLRGVDDEASLILAAGAIGNRIFRLAANYLTIVVIVIFFFGFALAIIGIRGSGAQDWLATGLLAFPVVASGVIMLSGIFKSTIGRELFSRGLTAEANIQSTPDAGPNTEMTVKTLRAVDKNMRHKLYDHPAACEEIVDWFVQCNVVARSRESEGN